MIFYGLVLLASSVVITVMWRYIARHRDLLEPGVSDEEIAAITLIATPHMAFYALVLLLAVIAPRVAAFGYLAIAVVVVFRSRGDYTAPARRGLSPGDTADGLPTRWSREAVPVLQRLGSSVALGLGGAGEAVDRADDCLGVQRDRRQVGGRGA